MKRIVVTGGCGFIGSNLVKFLLKKKYKVLNIDNLSYSANPYNLKNVKSSKNYKFVKQNINDKEKIYKIFKKFKPEGIFNLAAETHVDRSIDDPKNFINTNIIGVYSLLLALYRYKKKIKKKIKLVHVSTDEVYGDINFGKKSKEKYPYTPSSPYAASKASADHLIKSFFRTYGIPAVISNCCNNYGPNQFPEKLIPKLIYNILQNKPLTLYGRGKNIREWIYVEDHCEALLKILEKGKVGESYNVGTSDSFKNIDIAKKLLKIFNNKKIKIRFVKDRPGHDIRYSLDYTKIKKKLGWRKKTKFEEGILKTVYWYLNNQEFFSSVSKKLYSKRLGLKKL